MFGKKASYTISVEGMMCERCAARVAAAVAQTRGAKAVANIAQKTVEVTCPAGADIEKIVADIIAAGYKAERK